MVGGESVRFRLVPPGAYRVISGDVEQRVEVASGDEVTIDVGQRAASDRRDVRVTARDRTAYGTRFNAAALELLPQSNGLYGLIERSDPLVITERMEGGGTYPEPQRMGASGASWTQTTFKLGDADITDPDRTGYAMLYPNLDTLEAVSVATAGIHPDTYGAGTAVTLVPRMPSSKWMRTVQFDISPPAFQSVNPLPEAASIARLRSSSGGSFVASGPLTPRLGIQVAGTLNEYTRLERERVDTMPSRDSKPVRAPGVQGASRATTCGSSCKAIASRFLRSDGRCWSTRSCSSASARRCSPPPGIAPPAPGSPGRRT